MPTTKQSGLGDNFYVAGYDLSGDISSVDTISSSRAVIDVTAMNQYGYQRVGGLRDGTMSFTSFFDNTTAVSNPGVPASTVPLASTYPFPVQVTLTGGTITHVFVNSVESYVPVAPAVPGSQVAVTNTTGAIVNITISGGTMTGVYVGGFLLGTGAGVYQVRPGQQIYMVYTVAPTWTWANGGATYTIPAFGTISITYSVAPTWNWFPLGGIHNVLAPMPSADIVISYLRGTDMGNPAACINAKETNYNPTRDASANLTIKVDAVANSYGLEWGIQLTNGLRFDIAPTTGPYQDTGPGNAFGCQAYLQIVELVGTNIDVSITHATTSGGSYSTLLDFGSQTAIGGFRQSVSNTTTVNEFMKVATAGTFTFAAFAVVIVRNPIAGIVF
jgi:hypothetical protein